jgi:hypothetical protein
MWWNQFSRLWTYDPDDAVDQISAPTLEQQQRARRAYERLRKMARSMKSPFTSEEIIQLIRAGRR